MVARSSGQSSELISTSAIIVYINIFTLSIPQVVWIAGLDVDDHCQLVIYSGWNVPGFLRNVWGEGMRKTIYSCVINVLKKAYLSTIN